MVGGSDIGDCLRRLQAVVHDCGGILSEEDIATTVLEQAVAAVGGRGAILRLLAPDGDHLVEVGAVGLSAAFLGKGEVAASQREVDRRVLEGECVVVDDVTREADYPYAAEAAAEGLHGAVNVPLCLRDRAVGLVRVFVDQADALAESDLLALRLLADLGALAIEKARLHDSLVRLSQALNASLELPTMLTEVLDTTIRDMGFGAASIHLLGKSGRVLKVVAAVGLGEAYLRQGEVALKSSAVDRQALDGETVVVHDVPNSTVWPNRRLLEEEGIQAVMVVPLTLAERRLGVIRAYSRRPREFGPVARGYLGAVSGLVSLAIEKAELHQALRMRYEGLKLDLAEWYRFLAIG